MNALSNPALVDEANRLLNVAARLFHSTEGRRMQLDEIRSLGAGGVARALAEWDGQGLFGPFVLQRARWSIINGLRQLARQERRGLPRDELLATAAVCGAAEAATMKGRPGASLVKKMLREAASSFDVELSSAPVVASDPDEVEDDAERIRVRRATERLPEPGRQIIHRHYYLGETFEEISEAMGIPSSTLHDIHRRALRSLWEAFRPPSGSDSVTARL